MNTNKTTGQVQCDRCEAKHEATYSHEGQFNEGPIFAVVCDSDWLTEYVTNEIVERPEAATPWMQAQIDAVRAYAIEHYDEDGWDIVVEAYDDAMIEEILRGSWAMREGTTRSAKGAIKRMKRVVQGVASVRSDMMSTAF